MLDDRKEKTLEKWFRRLSKTQMEGIEAVAMDVWGPYVQVTRAALPDADKKIVFGWFHIVRHLLDAVDRVRREENKALRAEGDDRLVETKYDWLKKPDTFTWESWQRFENIRESSLKTAHAWAIKETALWLWKYRYVGAARNFFQRWYW